MHGNDIVQHPQTTNVTNLTKVIQESSYRVLQITSKQKTLKRPVHFLKVVEFRSTFDIQIEITLAMLVKTLVETLVKRH